MRIAERTLCSTAFALVAAFLAAGVAPAEELNSIVLRVNDEIATKFDYRERLEARLGAIAESDSLSPEERRTYAEEAPRATLREILDELLLLSRARQMVIEPDRAEIEEAIDNTRQRMGLPTEAAFESALRASNMTLDDYRERTARSIKANQVIQREVNPQVTVEDDWTQRYYREHPEEFRIPAKVKVRELVIPQEKVSGQAALDLAAQLRTALAAGEEMAAAAARLGGDRVVGPVDLGWVEPGELASALDTAVWSLPPGALSAPVEARGGLHLLEVQERVESSMKPYTDVKSEIESEERGRRHDEALRKYLAELEKKAYLVENVPPEAAGFREHQIDPEDDPLAAFAPRREAAAPANPTPPPMESIPPPSKPPSR